MVAVAYYAFIASPWATVQEELGLLAADVNTLIVLLVLVFAAAVLTALLGKRVMALVAVTSVTPTVVLFLTWFVFPDVTPYVSSRDIGIAYGKMLVPGEKMVFCGQLLDGAMFYAGRESKTLNTRDELQDYLSSPESAPAILKIKTAVPGEVQFHVVLVDGNKAIVDRMLPADKD